MGLKEEFLRQVEIEIEEMQISADSEEAINSAKASITSDLIQGAIILSDLILRKKEFKKEDLETLQHLLIEEQEGVLSYGI